MQVACPLPPIPISIRPLLTGPQLRFATAARAELAARLRLDPRSIAIDSYESVEFNDSSLGFPTEDGAYGQCMLDGFVVRYAQGGHRYEFHGISRSVDDGVFGEVPRGAWPDFWKLDNRGIYVPDAD